MLSKMVIGSEAHTADNNGAQKCWWLNWVRVSLQLLAMFLANNTNNTKNIQNENNHVQEQMTNGHQILLPRTIFSVLFDFFKHYGKMISLLLSVSLSVCVSVCLSVCLPELVTLLLLFLFFWTSFWPLNNLKFIAIISFVTKQLPTNIEAIKK